MNNWDQFKEYRVVRLNAQLFPPDELELAMYRRYGLDPLQVEATTPQEIIPYVADCDAVFAVSVSLPREVVERMERCRLISRLGNGTDKIDVAAATRAGIVVSNVPYFCVEEMADHALAFILALNRKMLEMSRHMRAGAYQQARHESLQIHRLRGQTLGLIGFGATGKAMAQRAQVLGMRVIATRKNKQKLHEMTEMGVEAVDLDTLLRESDFVSLQLPLTSETYHLLDEAALRRMKPGAYLINTARGAIVDEQALARVLREGHLAGAGLDTFGEIAIFVEDPEPPDHPLVELDNVILTPHVSGLSVEAKEEISIIGVQNVVAVLSGYWPQPDNIVNPTVRPRWALEPYDAALFNEAATVERA